MRQRACLFFCVALMSASSVADELASFKFNAIEGMHLQEKEEKHRITHANDPELYILVTILHQEPDAFYNFKLCKIGEESKCQKIGRYDFYSENELTALRSYFLLVGRIVFWGEAAVSTAAVLLATAAIRRNPEDFQRGRADGPVLESAPRAAAMAMRAPLPQPEHDSPSPFALLARVAGQAYEQYGKAILFGFLFNIKSDLMSFISTMTSLLTTSLSPAEHYRSVHLIDNLKHPNGDIHIRKRDYASFSEYFGQFHFTNIGEVTNKIEDLLESI